MKIKCTNETQKVLAVADGLVRDLGGNVIGIEHILWSILFEEKNILSKKKNIFHSLLTRPDTKRNLLKQVRETAGSFLKLRGYSMEMFEHSLCSLIISKRKSVYHRNGTGIEMFKKSLEKGMTGDSVGILTRGTSKAQIKRGMVEEETWELIQDSLAFLLPSPKIIVASPVLKALKDTPLAPGKNGRVDLIYNLMECVDECISTPRSDREKPFLKALPFTSEAEILLTTAIYTAQKSGQEVGLEHLILAMLASYKESI
jgi:hypothetical protein